MASTNKTPNYELSQYVGTDKPTYLGDYNSDMSKIDTQMKTNADNIAEVSEAVGTVETTANTALENAGIADTKAETAKDTADSALAKALANETAISNIKTSFTRIASFQTANSNQIVTVADLDTYHEFIVSLSPAGSPERCLASITVPALYFLGVGDPGNRTTASRR